MNHLFIHICVLALALGAGLRLPAQDSLQAQLMLAVERGDLHEVKACFQRGADANMSVVASSPAYLFFISRRLYLDGLAKTRPGEIVYVGPIHANAARADLKVLDYLRKKKANIDAGDSDGKTPLMYALRNPGGEAYALYLLKKGANYRAVDLAGNTVLHYAAYGGNIEGLRMAVGGGIDINARNHEGITPLHAAAVFSDVRVLQEIVSLGGDIHALDSVGMGTLHYAAAFGDRDRLDWILDQAPELNVEAQNGYTPLDIARAADNDEAAIYLKRKGGKVSAYRYAEMLAAIHAHDAPRLRTILQDGANANRKAPEYPLVLAVQEGDLTVLQWLLEAGAEVNVRNQSDKTPMDIALDSERPSVALALLRAGAGASPQQLGHCMDVIAQGKDLGNWVELATALATKISDLDAPSGKLLIPPLHYACYLGQEPLVEALLRAGAHVEARDSEGWTALHWTAMKRDLFRLHLEKLRIAQALLAAGASVNPKATTPKKLPHTEPYLARRVPAHATPLDLLAYAPPKDLDLSELLTAVGGASGLEVADILENGRALFETQQIQSAQLEFSKVIAADTGAAEAYYLRARCLSLLSQYEEMERDLSHAIRLQPRHPKAHLYRAKARIELQRYPEAKADAEQALALGHPPGEAYYWLGKVKLRLEDRNGACEDFRESGVHGYEDGVQAVKLYCK